jgi:hypothetical protein
LQLFLKNDRTRLPHRLARLRAAHIGIEQVGEPEALGSLTLGYSTAAGDPELRAAIAADRRSASAVCVSAGVARVEASFCSRTVEAGVETIGALAVAQAGQGAIPHRQGF